VRLKLHGGFRKSGDQGICNPYASVVRLDERPLLRCSSEGYGAGDRKRQSMRVGKNCSAAVRLTGMFFRRFRGNCRTSGPRGYAGSPGVRRDAVEGRVRALARGLQSTLRS